MERSMSDIKTITTSPVASVSVPPSTPVTNAVHKKRAPGLSFGRFFTNPGVSPYDELEWELRLAQITDAQRNVIFEQNNVPIPKDWSMTATHIVASKYHHGKVDTPNSETGGRPLVTLAPHTTR